MFAFDVLGAVIMFEQRFCARFSFKKCKCNWVFILSIKCSLYEKWRIFLLKNKEPGHSKKKPETYNRESKGTLVQSKLYIFPSDFLRWGITT